MKRITCICANEGWLEELAPIGMTTRCELHIQSSCFPLILGDGGRSARINSYISASILTIKMPSAREDTCAPDYDTRWFIMMYKGTSPLGWLIQTVSVFYRGSTCDNKGRQHLAWLVCRGIPVISCVSDQPVLFAKYVIQTAFSLQLAESIGEDGEMCISQALSKLCSEWN